jgi:hypothetical protein
MDNILISKSSRHSKITGNFAEHFVLYWLSKYGFECAYVDHVGIDLIANNPHTSERMGISVKARSRSEGTENDHMVIGPTLGRGSVYPCWITTKGVMYSYLGRGKLNS